MIEALPVLISILFYSDHLPPTRTESHLSRIGCPIWQKELAMQWELMQRRKLSETRDGWVTGLTS